MIFIVTYEEDFYIDQYDRIVNEKEEACARSLERARVNRLLFLNVIRLRQSIRRERFEFTNSLTRSDKSPLYISIRIAYLIN